MPLIRHAYTNVVKPFNGSTLVITAILNKSLIDNRSGLVSVRNTIHSLQTYNQCILYKEYKIHFVCLFDSYIYVHFYPKMF